MVTRMTEDFIASGARLAMNVSLLPLHALFLPLLESQAPTLALAQRLLPIPVPVLLPSPLRAQPTTAALALPNLAADGVSL